MDLQRYPKQSYILLKRPDGAGRVNCVTRVRIILFTYGFGYAWLSQEVGNPTYFIKLFSARLNDCFRQKWYSDLNNSPKSTHCKQFKSALNVEYYLTIDLPYDRRKCFSNSRC